MLSNCHHPVDCPSRHAPKQMWASTTKVGATPHLFGTSAAPDTQLRPIPSQPYSTCGQIPPQCPSATTQYVDNTAAPLGKSLRGAQLTLHISRIPMGLLYNPLWAFVTLHYSSTTPPLWSTNYPCKVPPTLYHQNTQYQLTHTNFASQKASKFPHKNFLASALWPSLSPVGKSLKQHSMCWISFWVTLKGVTPCAVPTTRTLTTCPQPCVELQSAQRLQ